MGSFPRWKTQTFENLPYDGRLAIEELCDTLRRDVKTHPGDAQKRAVASQFGQILLLVPDPSRAVGCGGEKIKGGDGGCFIATACYHSCYAPEVVELRRFRDETLRRSMAGRAFIRLYYVLSPAIARWLKRRPRISAAVRRSVLDRLVATISRSK